MKNLHTKYVVSIALIAGFLSISSISSTYASNYFNMGGNTYECTDPTADGYDVSENKCYSWCFVEDTKVTMADGTLKSIEDVQVGDWLQGSAGPNQVEYLVRKFNNGNIYGFNGGKKFVTDSHPFMTTQGRKSINPESTRKGHPGVDVSKLEIGDTLITEDGSIEIKSIESEYAPQKVYTFGVNGTHDYYADGYLVHNKYAGSNGSCPSGWFALGGAIYDWSPRTLSRGDNDDNCAGRDLGAPLLIGPGGGGNPIADVDIINLIYRDKNGNGTYDAGDRGIQMPTYAVSTGGVNGIMIMTGPAWYNPYIQLWSNNSVNLSIAGTYNYGISLSSSPWTTLINQGFTTIDQTTGSVLVASSISYITGINVGLQASCVGSGTQTVSFVEYSCPAPYNLVGSMCYTSSTQTGGPCTSNADCSSGGTCNGYTPPNSAFKYNDGQPWNSSHPYWNAHPHANSAGYCRNGDPANGCVPNDPNQNPNWYGGGILCGCTNFVPNTDSTPGTCSTSSQSWIAPTEIIVTDTMACSGGTGNGGGCTPSRTCPGGYSLTGDTNGNGTPNCISNTVSATLDTNFGGNGVCNGTAGSACVALLSCGCDGGENSNMECNTNNTNLSYWQSYAGQNAPFGCEDIDGSRSSNHTVNYYQVNTNIQNVEASDSNSCSGGPINGACGSANGQATYPGTGFKFKCSAGTFSSFTGNNPWTRTCLGTNGGTDAQCSAGSACSLDQQDPIGCDLTDVGIAGVCYIPSSFGTTLLVKDGKVGINTANPTATLDVNGVIRAAKVYQISDATLKSSIEKIDSALEKISKVNGYQFSWKKDGQPDMGVLAQEVEKVFSYAVQTDPSGTKTVQYTTLIAPIVEAIHEINNIVDEQAIKAQAQADHISKLEKAVK